ncbi:hypothetical protein ACDW34_12160 [Acinetobacter piscicola]|uniref:hypothetical protein n=1 Tax=Acinetobacter piscicola TaxID=2006115 RepID=UPI0035581652
MKIKHMLSIILMCGLLQACYPVYKTIRTPVQVEVVDEQGKAIKNAKVVMETTQRPAHVMPVFNRLFTDAQGKVEFKRQRKWAMETLFIHGFQVYSWNLCISKQGYEMPKSIDLKKQNGKSIRIILKQQKVIKTEGNECFDETMDPTQMAY